MPRKSQLTEIRKLIQDYLEIAVTHSPTEHTINIERVAHDLKMSRTTIYKYKLDIDIKNAIKEQVKNAKKSGKIVEKEAYKGIISDLRKELEEERERNKKLISQILIMEANAARLGIDPEEYYKELSKPDRSISKAGNVKKFRRR